MSSATPADASSDRAGEQRWWLDPGLAKLAFGTRPAQAVQRDGEATMHLAFLPIDALELDLSDPAQREFGDYELLEQIGQGGMGVVYRAQQKSLEREVALKLLSAGPWASEEFIAGFKREARNAASLQHPNIVAVYEMGEQDGLIYYAMQLIRGESLAQRLQARKTLPPREAATLLRTVAEAVDYAHKLGVLHLDLKPGNILLDAHGVALVTDFGLARRLGQAPSLENEQISGTPSYMAPEQAQVRNARLSPATDIWGIGAILYEALTGHPPFVGDSPEAILQLVLSGTVRSPARYAHLPRDLEAICLKCLNKPQEERYAYARDFADDLGRFLDNRSVQARPLNALQRMARWAKREPKFATASGLAVVALVAGLAATTQQWQRADRNAMTASERLWEGRRETALRLEQDGDGWQALPRLLQNARELEQAGRNDAALLDRRRIGLLLGQGATLIDTIAIADAHPLAVAVSDDGSRVAIALSDQSVRWYDTATLEEQGRISLRGRLSSGGQPRSILLLRFVGNDRLRATLEWFRHYVSPTDGDSWLLDLARGTVLEPPAGFADFSDANFSRDGGIALMRNRQRQVQAWRTAPWMPLSAPVTAPAAGPNALPWMIGADGRHAMALDAAMQKLHLYALPQLRHVRTLEFPQDAGVSAWAFSPDGGRVALGNSGGRVSLLDPATGALRALPSSRGREITWLAFSEDGAWLAAGGLDGRVQTFMTDSGDPLVSGDMAHDFAVRRVGISRARGLLVVAGEGRTALWRLPPTNGSLALPPIRVGAPPAMHDQAGAYAIDWSLRSGLLASAGIDGQVRLWRLPPSPTAAATVAPQLPESLHFDGIGTVDVAWNRLRTTTMDGTRSSRWLTLPQPPGFAELTADGRTLVVTVGPQLRVYDVPPHDAASLRLRAAPTPLPVSPQRLLLSRDGRRALLGFAARHADGFGDRLQLHDLRTGQTIPGEVVLPGPQLMLAFSHDGKRIVAVGPTDAATTVLGADPLRVLGEYPHDPYQPVVAADFAANGRDLLLVERADDPRLGADALLAWDPATDAVHARHAIENARPYGVIALAQGAFLPGERDHLLYDGSGFRRIPRPQTAVDPTMGAYAASPDRRLLAVGSLRSVQLYSTQGVPFGAVLRIDTSATDGIGEIAFSADGRRLIARTVWTSVQWPVAPEPRPEAELDALLDGLQPRDRRAQHLRVPAAQWRAALRARDPGPWPDVQQRPTPAIAGHAVLDGAPIPARAPGTPDTLLDLTALYTIGPDSTRSSRNTQRPFLRPYPAGTQRIGGIDFDLRGIVEVDRRGLADCLRVPDAQPVGAIHALLQATVRIREDRPRQVAELVLHYRDGGQARVPIRTGREVEGYGGGDHSVPIAFVARPPRAAMGLRTSSLAAPRLANPQPERAVRCIDLRTSGDPMLVFGLTVEPADQRRTAAVISSRGSR